MTMEEYFTKKAAAVEDVFFLSYAHGQAIISHCSDICDLIMSQYEEARNKELRQYEQPAVSASIFCTQGFYGQKLN